MLQFLVFALLFAHSLLSTLYSYKPLLTWKPFYTKDRIILICTMPDSLELEVLLTLERYNRTDGQLTYADNSVLYRLGSAYYVGSSNVRYRSKEEVKFEDIFDSVLIPEAHLTCPFPEHFTRAPDPLPTNCYVKKPEPMFYSWSKPTELSDTLLHEAAINEMLKQHPRPNLAKYHGCLVTNDRITGLVFEKYDETLMSRVNPRCSGKRLFDATKRPLKDVNSFIEGIKRGVEHLHSLGLVHNNINPASIMFPAKDDDVTAVIIDFGSCKRIGECPKGVTRIVEWHDVNETTSLPSTDLDAVDEMAEWLRNGKNFKFELWC
jgi:serine/threonine protein kinase